MQSISYKYVPLVHCAHSAAKTHPSMLVEHIISRLFAVSRTKYYHREKITVLWTYTPLCYKLQRIKH